MKREKLPIDLRQFIRGARGSLTFTLECDWRENRSEMMHCPTFSVARKATLCILAFAGGRKACTPLHIPNLHCSYPGLLHLRGTHMQKPLPPQRKGLAVYLKPGFTTRQSPDRNVLQDGANKILLGNWFWGMSVDECRAKQRAIVEVAFL